MRTSQPARVMVWRDFPLPVGRIGIELEDGHVVRIALASDADAEEPKHLTSREKQTLAHVVSALKHYIKTGEMGAIPVAVHGTPFQQKVWRALSKVRSGSTVSYSELARRAGSPGAARAVGSACAANPIPIIVPCHRVLAAQGRLGGFSGGLDRKVALLRHEGVAVREI